MVGTVVNYYYYRVAWTQPDNDGLATDSMLLAQTPDGRLIDESFSRKDRFWLVALPMQGTDGTKKALLTIQVSSKIIDELTKYNRNSSVILLVATVFVIILFLLVVVRLWDYALLYRKMREVDRMKDEFISMASHELRTPVTGIKGYVQMILDGSMGEINDKVKKSANIIKGASERLAILVEDLLNVSRIEQGRMNMTIKEMDISAVITRVVGVIVKLPSSVIR